MKNYFHDLVKIISQALEPEENFTADFSGEELEYTRFNKAKIRQAGNVSQNYLEINLIKNKKQAKASLSLQQNLDLDKQEINNIICFLRPILDQSQDDPYLFFNTTPNNSEIIKKNKLGAKEEILPAIFKNINKLDFVGCYMGGPIYRGFANSWGQKNWFENSSFILDWSIYHSQDKAIKQSYAADKFDPAIFGRKIESATRDLHLLAKPSQEIKPGSYRSYFSPTALYEILSLINWGGFSKRALKVKNSPLMPVAMEQKSLSQKFSLSERISHGIGPNWQSQGFLKPDCMPIIASGKLKNLLISPTTAKEYQLDHNGAEEDESLCAMDVAPGTIPEIDVLNQLDTGLYISNLWYLNYSDRVQGCLTGMTRFLCYKVENGKPVAPFGVMRFDDCIFSILGENLENLTKERELIIDTSSYDERSTSCALLPGILVNNVRLTL